MLTALDIVIFLKSRDDLGTVGPRVFGALGTPHAARSESEETGIPYIHATGLGFEAILSENTGDNLDPEFEEYDFALNITSQYADTDLDAFDLDEPLSEYFARLLAFELNTQTATEILVDTTEEAEVFDIRAYRRNPQYRPDSGPLIPRTGMVESRQVVEPFVEMDEEEDTYGDEDA